MEESIEKSLKLQDIKNDYFFRLTDAQKAWGRSLMISQRADADNDCGVIGYGRHADDEPGHFSVWVGPETDISDEEVYLRIVDGETVNYRLQSIEPQV